MPRNSTRRLRTRDRRDLVPMTRDNFVAFTSATLEKAVALAEHACGRRLSRELCFRWLHSDSELVCSNVAEYIAARVYLGPEEIYPCIDIGVGGVLDDGRTLIVARVANYAPRPFGSNWTGSDGPFVLMYATRLHETK